MEGENEVVTWFNEQLLPEILRQGHFPTGTNPKIAKCTMESTERFIDHFASSPYFTEITVDSDQGPTVLNLLVKFCCQDDRVIEIMHLEKQYQNEDAFYSKILKGFREFLATNSKVPSDFIDQLIPKCYYGRYDSENTKKSVLVFENQRKLGFKTADAKVYLDFEHCAIAMKQLGRFHAISLSIKIKQPELLTKLKESLIEARYYTDAVVVEECNAFFGISNLRGVDHLLSQNPTKIPEDYLIKMKKMLSQPFELFQRLIIPKEPIALLCHGDYCRNNLIFRYDGDRVADAKMFDFQVTRYMNPTVDLAFFIYLNTTQQLRDEHLDELLKIYYSSLISTAALITDVPETEMESRYPFKLIADDFADKAVYGYCHVSFFLAVMALEGDMDWDLSVQERAEMLSTVGGEKLSERIADIILDFYKRGFYVS